MYITVRLLTNFNKPLTYSVPEALQLQIEQGSLVQVPLQNRIVPAVVHSISFKNKEYGFTVRNIDSVFPFPKDPFYVRFIGMLSQYYQIDSIFFLKRLKHFLTQKEAEVDAEIEVAIDEKKDVVLTTEQQQVVDALQVDIDQSVYQVTLLHGVTGSGKTEVYKKLFEHVVAQGKTALFLLPEVTLSLQFELLLKQQLQDIPVFGFHSATSVKQKRALWQALLQQRPCVIVGVHLPVLLPIAKLGLIVVDEEHDPGYQEKNHPKIQTKNAAIAKACEARIPILLGSATPSMTSLWNVKHKGWRMCRMLKRFAGNFPQVKIVYLKDKKERKHFWISSQLFQAITRQLAEKKQTIIFINRRGFSFFVQCKSCSFIFSCGNCSVSLTLHGTDNLLCHYCGFKQCLPESCSTCKSSDFLKKGIGTQQVVTILEKLFPQAVINRADLDTTTKKKAWQQTLQDFKDKKIDILVGTQSITKGYHFPHVTLVGVLWADVNLHFPMYNAAETTLQQLIQVAGRAGRQSAESLVILQTMTQHPLFNFVEEQNYISFYEHEVHHRSEVGYPPCKHIAEIEVRHTDQEKVESEADIIAEKLMEDAIDVSVLGPVPAVVYRVKKTFCQKIFLKSTSRKRMIDVFARLNQKSFSSSIFFTIDPIS